MSSPEPHAHNPKPGRPTKAAIDAWIEQDREELRARINALGTTSEVAQWLSSKPKAVESWVNGSGYPSGPQGFLLRAAQKQGGIKTSEGGIRPMTDFTATAGNLRELAQQEWSRMTEALGGREAWTGCSQNGNPPI
jgi:hypothetical protein